MLLLCDEIGNELLGLKMLLWILLLETSLCFAAGNVTGDVCKEKICACNEIEGDLHVDCEKKGIYQPATFHRPNFPILPFIPAWQFPDSTFP